MKTPIKLLVWLVSVMMSCSVAWCLFFSGGAGYRATPHANIQFLIQPGWSAETTINKAEKVILSLDYVRQLADSSKFGIQGERSYSKGNFTILYAPEDGEYSQIAVWLHFYQDNTLHFDDAGLAEYEALRAALVANGLKQSLTNDPQYPGRTILTPAMFNEKYSGQERTSGVELVQGLATLFCYTLIFFTPGFWVAFKLLAKLAAPVIVKRVIFVFVTSLLLAPAPLPIIMFGPMFWLPVPFAIPFALESAEYLRFALVAILCTLLLATLLSLLIRPPLPDTDDTESAALIAKSA